MAKAGTAYITFRADFSEFKRDLARAIGDVERFSGKEGEVQLKADSSDLRRELHGASGELRGFEARAKAAEASVGDMGDNMEITRKRVVGLGSSIGATNSKFMLFRNTIRLIKWPALIAGVGGAAQGISALAAGVAGLTGALTPLSGLLAAYPALLGAIGQAAGVTALAGIKDLTDAMAGNEEALKRLTPEAKSFMQTLQKMEPQYRKLQRTAQRNLFAGAGAGLKDALKNFPELNKVIGATADAMGDLARRAGSFLGRSGFGRDFATIGKGNARLLEQLGRAGLHFADALRHVMVVAQPLINFLGNSIVKFSKFVEEEAKAGRESGRMAQFFRQTEQVFRQLVSIGGSLASVFREIGKAGAPLGRDILRSLERGADSLERWAESTRGRNSLQKYFKDAKPAIFETGRLIRDATKAFFELGTTGGLAKMIRQLRTELLPVLVEMTDATTKAFGPRLIELLVQAGKLMANFVGASGPLTLVVRGMTQFLRLVNALVESNPLIKNTLVTFVGIATALKALQFAKAVSGFNAIRNAMLGTAAAGAATQGGLVAATTGASYSKVGTAVGLGLAKAVRVAVPGAFAALAIGQTISKAIEGDTKGAAIQAAGTAIGGALGAAIGSAIPGAGTLLGGLVGAGIGGIVGDLVGNLFEGTDKVTKAQDRLKRSAKDFARAMKDVRQTSLGLKQSSKDVQQAHERQRRAARNVREAEERYQEALRRFGPNSRQAIKAQRELTQAKRREERANKEAARAEKLHGLQLDAAKQIYRSVLGAQNRRIKVLKDEQKENQRALRTAVEENKGRKRSEEGTERVRRARQRLNRTTSDLDRVERKHNQTILKASDQIGGKLARQYDKLTPALARASRETIKSNREISAAARAASRTHRPLNRLESDTDKIGRQMGETKTIWAKGGKDMEKTEKSLANTVYKGHKNIGDNTNKMAKTFDQEPLKYQLVRPGSGQGGKQEGGIVKLARRALGGALVPGMAPGDNHTLTLGGRPIAKVESQEGIYVVNRTAQKYLNWVNSKIPRRARGGFIDPAGPGTGIVNKAIADVVGRWSQKYNAAINFGYDPGGGHVSPGHNVTGTATDTSPAGGWTKAATALFERGLRAIEGSVDQILYGDGGAGVPYPDHGRYNHAHIEWGMHPELDGLGVAEQIGRYLLKGPAGILRNIGQASLDTVRNHANAWISDNLGAGFAEGAVGGWKGINSVAKFIPYWNRTNPQHKQYASRFGRIVQAESTFNPRAINHIGLGHAGWYQYDPPTWRAYDQGAGNPAWPAGPFNAGAATVHTGTMLDHEGASTFSRWAATDPGARRGGLIKGFANGGAVRLPRLRNGGTGGTGTGGNGGDGDGTKLPTAPGFGGAGSGFLAQYLRRIKRGVKGALEEVLKIIGLSINDDSPWGVSETTSRSMENIRRQADAFAEYAGIANTLTTEVTVPATTTTGEGTLTILGLAGPGKQDEGFWLTKQLVQLKGFALSLTLADRFIAGMMTQLDEMKKYSERMRRIRDKWLKEVKRKLKKTQKNLREARAALRQAKGDAERKKIQTNIKHLEKREKFFEAEVKGEGRVISALTDSITPELEAEKSAAVTAADTIRSDLDEVQGITGKGGTIFDVNQALVAFKALKADLLAEGEPIEPDVSERDSEIEALLRQMLEEEQKRNLVLAAQIPVFEGFFGNFQGGGVVPGPAGAARPILAHGNEVVLTPEQAAAMGGTHVTVVVEDGAVDPNKINTVVSNHLRDEQSRARRMAGGRV